jgi:tagatose-6-phosphate ketose/aldose isomerase
MISAVAGAARSCVIVLDDAVNDRSLAMTSSFTNMVVMGQCLAHAWSVDEYAPVLERLVTAGREFLMTAGQEASRLAEMGYRRICLVASGSLVSAAKESALKVLEMTAGQVQTMPETILGLRHGPMAALDGKVLFVCFVSHDPRRALYAADLLREVGEKGLARERVVVGPVSLRQKLAPRCECYLSVPDDVADGYRPVLDVIFGQLLGLYASIACDLKPDAPSPGGVINRVVQEFRIY